MPLGLDQKGGALVWSPLGWGRLTGKVRRGQPLPAQSRLHQTAEVGPPVLAEHVYKVVDAIDAIVRETEKTVAQVALNWLLRRPTVSSVILGARNEDQLRQNLGAADWRLTEEQIASLDAASETTPVYPYLASTSVRRANSASDPDSGASFAGELSQCEATSDRTGWLPLASGSELSCGTRATGTRI
jgi:Aldo/keto reductase family